MKNKNLIGKFRTHFISGLLVLAPLFITVIVVRYLVRITDAMVVDPVFNLLPFGDIDATFKIFLAKLIIAIVVLAFVTLIGLGAEQIIFKQFLVAGEAVLKSIPLFNKVYGSVREIAQAFFGDKRGIFRSVVYVEYPRKGLYALGFVTQDRRWDIHEQTGRDIVTVFIPSPPNPATGNFIFVPKEDIIPSDLSVEDGLKLVISGGAAVPEIKGKR